MIRVIFEITLTIKIRVGDCTIPPPTWNFGVSRESAHIKIPFPRNSCQFCREKGHFLSSRRSRNSSRQFSQHVAREKISYFDVRSVTSRMVITILDVTWKGEGGYPVGTLPPSYIKIKKINMRSCPDITSIVDVIMGQGPDIFRNAFLSQRVSQRVARE